MNRAIKFKAITVDSGEWIYGNLYVPSQFLAGVYISPETNYADFAPNLEEGDDVNEAMKNGCAIGRFIEVNPETACQFTGLLDKNGAEIYEGDIYSSIRGSKHVVTFLHGAFCGRFLHGKDGCDVPLAWTDSNEGETLGIRPDIGFLNDIEVTGNIHDK